MKPILSALTLLCLASACSTPTSTPAPPASAFPAKLKALGTEPFWSLGIDGDTVAYSTAEQPAAVAARVERRETAGELALGGVLAGDAITVNVTRETCSDGMSDRVYPYAVKVRLGAKQLAGCGS